MGYAVQGRLEEYWTKMEQLCCPFYGQKMVRVMYYHILCFIHFTDNNRNRVDRTDDRLRKIWDLFEILRQTFQNFTSPQKTQKFWHQIVQTVQLYWMYMTLILTSVKTYKGRHNTWQQPMLLIILPRGDTGGFRWLLAILQGWDMHEYSLSQPKTVCAWWTPRGNTALPIMGALLGGLRSNPATRGNKTTTTNENV